MIVTRISKRKMVFLMVVLCSKWFYILINIELPLYHMNDTSSTNPITVTSIKKIFLQCEEILLYTAVDPNRKLKLYCTSFIQRIDTILNFSPNE